MPAAIPEVLLLLLAGASCVGGIRLSPNKAEDEAVDLVDETSVVEYPYAVSGGNKFRTSALKATVSQQVLSSKPSWTFKEEMKEGVQSTTYNYSWGPVQGAPLVDDQMNLYVSTLSGSIYKMSPEGQIIWTYQRPAGARLPGTPAIMNGTLYSADTKGRAFAVDMETGVERWDAQASQCCISDDAWSVAVGEGVVLVPAIHPNHVTFKTPDGPNTRLVALDATNGNRLHRIEAFFGCTFTNVRVAIRNGSYVYSDEVGNVWRRELISGIPIWQTLVKRDTSPNIGGVAISPKGDTVFATWNEVAWDKEQTVGMVGALNFADGRLLWRRGTELTADTHPAVGLFGKGPAATLAVVVATGVGPTSRFDWQAGDVAGQDQQKAQVVGFAADGPRAGSLLFKQDIETGKSAVAGDATPCAHRGTLATPTIGSDGSIYLASQSGDMVVLQDGEVHTYNIGAAYSAPPVIVPGMLIATPCEGPHVWKLDL